MATPTGFEAYESFIAEMRSLHALRVSQRSEADVRGALDGAAATALRRLIPVDTRRDAGAFFTPHAMAERLAETIRDAEGPALILDPSCGAGDLLIAAARALNARGHRAEDALIGVDRVSQFVELSELRLGLVVDEMKASPRVLIRRGDGTSASELRTATHVLMNPPYGKRVLASDASWAGGSVNAAAPFFADCIGQMRSGAVAAAILPDVLRSGTRYAHWRDVVEGILEISTIERLGRFDRWTDVDVFLLRGVVRDSGTNTSPKARWTPAVARHTVGDRFDVSVGPVVHYRDPNMGSWHPYLTSQQFPAWETVRTIPRRRRYQGRTATAPFVVMPRTSSPSEAIRSRAALIREPLSVAVDNHLIVLTPLDGTVATCKRLLVVLENPQTSEWLNRRIGCRHLTVGAVRQIPWRKP